MRRGKIIELLEKNNLLIEFINNYWHYGKTEKGKSRIRQYKRIYTEFLNREVIEEEEEQERIEQTSFAYEDDIPLFLL
ncbi:unnamed protein product, partial [marine sediment metagenome]